MRRIFAPLLALLAVPLLATAQDAAFPAGWPNLAKSPTRDDYAAITAHRPAFARDVLGKALAKSYKPGASGLGSASNTTYAAWLLEWQWCDLLAQSEKSAAQRFLRPWITAISRGQYGLYSFSLLPPGKPQADDSTKLPPDALAQALNGPQFWLLLENLVPTNTPEPGEQPLGDLLPPDARAALTADPQFLRQFFNTLSPDDYAPGVMRNLAAMYSAQPGKFHDYSALAVALAVVFDQRFPGFWPHHQVVAMLVPKKDEPVEQRFAFWVKSNETGALLTDLRQLPAEQLKFVVDAPLDESELIWAQNNAQHGRPEFARTFGDITYNTRRMVNNELNWTTGNYTLANIQQVGGICVDQAYFGFICGKAIGLPTIYFDGQTKNGGHAWFGYLKGDNQWDMNCGRYASMGIQTGKAFDPQTWHYITDHELAYLTEAFRQQPTYAASRNDLVAAALLDSLGNQSLEAKALDSAIAVCPRNDAAWAAKTDFLQRTGAKYAALRSHEEAAIRQFTEDPDLRVAYQTALMALATQAGDHTTADGLQRQIVSQNETQRADLALSAFGEKISTFVTARDYTGALHEFQTEAPGLSHSAGGNLYYQVAEPLALALYYAGKAEDAQKVTATVRNLLQPRKNEILDTDITKLEKTLATPLKQVATR